MHDEIDPAAQAVGFVYLGKGNIGSFYLLHDYLYLW